MIAAIYARRSTEQMGVSEETKSVARQVERARAFAAVKGWVVADEYVFTDDGISGAEFKHRPGFAKLMAAVAQPQPPFQALVMSEPSRLGREAVATSAAFKALTEGGVRVFTYLDGREHTMRTALDKVMVSLQGFGSELEREHSSVRTHDALLKKFLAGHHVGGAVYGYRNRDVMGETDAHGRAKRTHVVLEVLPEQAAVVRRIFEAYAAGDGFTRIAKRLNADSVPAPRVGTGSWSPAAVREILRRPLYVGRVIWNRSQKIMRQGTKAQRVRPASEWLQHDAADLRIVEPMLWDAVERRRLWAATTGTGQRRGRPPGTAVRAAALLSGLAQCTVCGGSLVALTRRHGTGAIRTRVDLYGCSYHQKRGRAVCTNDVAIRQDRLDRVFLDALAEALDEQVMARAVTLALERVQRRSAEVPAERAALERERAAVATACRHLLDAVKRGQATETLLAELAGEEEKAKTLDRKLAALDARPRPVSLDSTRLKARLQALGRDVRGVLATGGPEARLVLQRLLSGRRVACEPFRTPGRRGYRFRASGSYAAMLVCSQNSNEAKIPLGPPAVESRFSGVSRSKGPAERKP